MQLQREEATKKLEIQAEINRIQDAEKLAAKQLRRNGFRILDRNRHESHNEIDIIARDREFLVFAEVKTRSVSSAELLQYGSAAAAVTHAKQSRLLTAASQYLRSHPKYRMLQPRLDVIEIYVDRDSHALLHINHIENAFGR